MGAGVAVGVAVGGGLVCLLVGEPILNLYHILYNFIEN